MNCSFEILLLSLYIYKDISRINGKWKHYTSELFINDSKKFYKYSWIQQKFVPDYVKDMFGKME